MLVAGGDARQHFVEGGREFADFVRSGNGRAETVVAGEVDLSSGFGELHNRTRDGPLQETAQKNTAKGEYQQHYAEDGE